MMTRSKKRILEISEDDEQNYSKKSKNDPSSEDEPLSLTSEEESELSSSTDEDVKNETLDSFGDDETQPNDFINLLKKSLKKANNIFSDDSFVKNIKNTDKKLYDELRTVRKYLLRKYVTLEDILRSSLKIKDKATLLEIYENLNSCLPFTDGWVETQQHLKQTYKRMIKLNSISKNPEELEEIKTQSKYLKSLVKIDNKDTLMLLPTILENKSIIYNRIKERDNCTPASEEYPKLDNWIKVALSIPYEVLIDIPIPDDFFYNAFDIIDEHLYGMKNVKEQLLTYLSVKLSTPTSSTPPLALMGPPGVGKTKIARLLAEMFKIPFQQICLGGVYNAEFLRGHNFTYVGSREGEIVRSLIHMKCKNGILFLDEFEKISDNKDILATLLHIVDPSQNYEYTDNYLAGIKIDLSKIWFICSMNSPPSDSALRDRFFIIDVPGYSFKEKVEIVLKYTIPRVLKNLGMNRDNKSISFSRESIETLVNLTSPDHEKGVRTVNSAVTDVIYKLHLMSQLSIKGLPSDDSHLISELSFGIKGIKFPFRVESKHISQLLKTVLKTDINIISNMYN